MGRKIRIDANAVYNLMNLGYLAGIKHSEPLLEKARERLEIVLESERMAHRAFGGILAAIGRHDADTVSRLLGLLEEIHVKTQERLKELVARYEPVLSKSVPKHMEDDFVAASRAVGSGPGLSDILRDNPDLLRIWEQIDSAVGRPEWTGRFSSAADFQVTMLEALSQLALTSATKQELGQERVAEFLASSKMRDHRAARLTAAAMRYYCRKSGLAWRALVEAAWGSRSAHGAR